MHFSSGRIEESYCFYAIFAGFRGSFQRDKKLQMRIYLKLSSNTELVPFNYQRNLAGAFHKWLGQNELHDDLSLYSLSWLEGAVPTKHGLNFPNGSEFFISSPLENLHTQAVKGIFNNQHICWGMYVKEVRLSPTPDFGRVKRFLAQSPILIKRKAEGEKHQRYYYPGQEHADDFLTETLRTKLRKMNLSTEVSVRFDPAYKNVKIKKIKFNNIDIKASFCPVIVEGDPRSVQFAWEVGVGNSTGIGFGALR